LTVENARAVREKINFISMHQPNAGDEGVMRGWNVYERVGASVVVVKDCIGSAIMHKSGKQISIWWGLPRSDDQFHSPLA